MTFRSSCLFTSMILVFSGVGRSETLESLPKGSRIDTTNYMLGTQTIGVKYGFTDQTTLVETSRRIREMGSNLLKFSMSNRYRGDHYHLPARDDIRSLIDLAQKEPSVKAVLEMPFAYYHIWVYPFAHGDVPFFDGLSEKEREESYAEIHDLAKHLLSTYRGSGKTFYLGHWEGDWHLHRNYDRKQNPDPAAIQGMIDWLNVRQKAIDDAKRKLQTEGVAIYHYTEINLVQKGMAGGKCLVNDVLPHTTVDYVSYSSYDTIIANKDHLESALHEALDYIESKLPAKNGIQGKRVFIGEYGFPFEVAGSAENQARYSHDVCLAALEWGCPFVLYWQVYCNEIRDGEHRGFWLIDDKNRKQPFYHTLRNYYAEMKRTLAEFEKVQRRRPTKMEFREMAIDVLKSADGVPGAIHAEDH